MAKYRQVHISFWQDDFVLDLTPEEKYFYLYLMTNSTTTQCGIYTLPIRVIELESGYNRETVEKLIARFVEYGKVLHSKETKEIMLTNWMKFNFINSDKVFKCIEKELEGVKNKDLVKEFHTRLIRYGYPIDTLSIDYGEEEEKEEKKNRSNNIIVEVIDYLNIKAEKSYKHSTKRTQTLIQARIKEGFALDDFKKVIDIKVKAWKNDSKMDMYLRPETLFSTKFESYLNEKTGLTNTVYANFGQARTGGNKNSGANREDYEKWAQQHDIPF
jgi:uncharacterized phage protein (TIGR02220 family)